MEELKSRLAKLIDVKSIVTFGLLAVVCVQAVRQNIQLPPEFLAATVGSVITYYFTRKAE